MSDGPQLMFKDRGFGRAEETAEEMSPFLVTGQVTSDEDLGELLDAMTELESEKMDDWSMLAAILEEQEPEEESIVPCAEEQEELKEEKREAVQEQQEPKKETKEKTFQESSVQEETPKKECREDRTDAEKHVIIVSETMYKHY